MATPVDSRFDDTFWRQMVYNEFDNRWSPPQRTTLVLPSTSPDVYVVDAPELINRIARGRTVSRLVQQLTGDSYVGTLYAVATRPMSPYRGIAVVLDDSFDECGFANVGALEGLIRLKPGCSSFPQYLFDDLFAHEFGHAMGFWHTDPYSTNPPGQNCMARGGWLGGMRATVEEDSRRASNTTRNSPGGRRRLVTISTRAWSMRSSGTRRSSATVFGHAVHRGNGVRPCSRVTF